MSETFTAERLQAALGPHLGGAKLGFERIATGRFNSAWHVSGEPGEFVLRVAPDEDAGLLFYERRMMRQEPEVHQLVREETHVPVAEVIALDTGHKVLPRDFILLRRLPGRPASEQPIDRAGLERLQRELGRALAQVHRITRPRFDYLGAHHPMKPQDTWPEAFSVMWTKLIGDCRRTGVYSKDEAGLMLRALEARLGSFKNVKRASLLHMDVWGQNVLTDDEGRLTGLLDWDRAAWGDPELEFAVLDYCGLSTPAFFAGYGRARPDGPAAQTRQAFYYLYEVQKYVVIESLRRSNPARAESYKRQAFTLLTRALGAEG